MKEAGIEGLYPLRFQRFEHNYLSMQAVIDGLGIGIAELPTLSYDLNKKDFKHLSKFRSLAVNMQHWLHLMLTSHYH